MNRRDRCACHCVANVPIMPRLARVSIPACHARPRHEVPLLAVRLDPLRLGVAHATPVNVARDWDHDGLAQVHHRVRVLERAIACQDGTACAAVRHGLQHVDAEERQAMRAMHPKRMLACHGFQLVEHLMNI